MNRLQSKWNVYSLFFLIAAIGTGLKATTPKERLLELLQDRPQLAKQFLDTVATKAAPTPVRTPAPKPQPKPVPRPVVKAAPQPVGMTDREKSALNNTLSTLESYAMSVYECLDAFFCITNCQPYAVHVACMKNQVTYLQTNLLQNFPRAETAKYQKLFTELQNLTNTLARAQRVLVSAVDQKYSSTFGGAASLGNEFRKIEPLLKTQQATANTIMNTIRGELPADTAPRLIKLRGLINRMFNYGNNMKITEALAVARHRLKR